MTKKFELFSPRNKYIGAFFTEEEIKMLEVIKDFVDKMVMPKRNDLEGGWHRDVELAEETHDELYERLVKLGFQKSMIPAEYGGMGASSMFRCAANEELARGDASFATHAGKILQLCASLNAIQGTELHKLLVPKIISNECWTSAICFTEPAGGTNAEDPTLEGRTIRTRAELKGDEYVINGHKIWVGPAGPPEVFQRKKLKGHLGYTVVATTDPSKGKEGIILLYVPADSAGLSWSNPFEKMGMIGDRNCEMWFENVKVPKEYLLGGADMFFGRISSGKISTAARCIGVAEALFEIGLEYTGTREILCKAVREYSLWAAAFGEMAREIEAARAYLYNVVWMTSHPEIYGPLEGPVLSGRSGAVRSRAAEIAIWVGNKVIEFLGSHGYAFESYAEKYLRDVKILQLWLGGPQRDLLNMALACYPFKWK